MYIRRTSDSFEIVSSGEIRPLSIWRPHNHHYVEIPTVTGVAYPDSRGVAQEYKRVRLFFADHYASTLTDYRRLWQAQRYRQGLTFQDRDGSTHNVRVASRIDAETTTLWDEVANRDIAIVEVELVKLEYYQ